jgi:hypothetical protein
MVELGWLEEPKIGSNLTGQATLYALTPRFTRANRPCKKRKLTDEQLDEAIKVREDGFAWRMLGDKYGVIHDTLRLALRDRGAEPQNRNRSRPNADSHQL